MAKLNVAVLRGGPSHLYDLSLKTGSHILKNMPDKYQAHDIFISKDGKWHREGLERSPDRALANIDVVINALHGHFGEDGKVQKILDSLSIPYTGSGSMASSMGMNKVLAKKIFQQHGIKTPYFATVKKEDDLQERVNYLFHHFFLPMVVKPATGSGSLGITHVESFQDLQAALEKALAHSDTALVEEFIRGREATAGVIENFRGERSYTFLPVEVAKTADNNPWHISPGNFSTYEKEELQRLAKYVHEALGLRHYSHSDFIITPRRGIYLLEVNTHPSLAEKSMMHEALDAIGFTFADFIDHLIILAQKAIRF